MNRSKNEEFLKRLQFLHEKEKRIEISFALFSRQGQNMFLSFSCMCKKLLYAISIFSLCLVYSEFIPYKAIISTKFEKIGLFINNISVKFLYFLNQRMFVEFLT